MHEHRQELVLALARQLQLLLRELVVVNVGAGTHPAGDVCRVVAHRQRPPEHPAVLVRAVAKAVLDFIRLTTGQPMAPRLPGVRLIVRVEHLAPAFAIGGVGGNACCAGAGRTTVDTCAMDTYGCTLLRARLQGQGARGV